jgi:hypothetical protein
MKKLALLLLLTTVACAHQEYPNLIQRGQDPSEWSPTSPPTVSRTQRSVQKTNPTVASVDQYNSRADELQRQLEENTRRLYDGVHVPLNAFLRGPRGDCASAHLHEAAGVAAFLGASSGQMGADLDMLQQTAGWILDVADGASEHGCPDTARKLYRYVIETYIGLGYTAHRQRAEIGLADLRGSDVRRVATRGRQQHEATPSRPSRAARRCSSCLSPPASRPASRSASASSGSVRPRARC